MTALWTLDTAIATVRELEARLSLVGYHAALAGGALMRGSSEHDLDVIVFPHDASEDRRFPQDVMEAMGWMRYRTVEQVRAYWRSKGGTDTKHVEVWHDREARRVDLLVLR